MVLVWFVELPAIENENVKTITVNKTTAITAILINPSFLFPEVIKKVIWKSLINIALNEPVWLYFGIIQFNES